MGWFTDAFAFLAKGGPVMVPLIACSIIALTVAIERYITMRAATADTTVLAKDTERLLKSGEPERAAVQCEASGSPIGTVLAMGIRNRHLGLQRVESAMQDRAQRMVSNLQIRLCILDTIVTIAPLLGLLGTVVGMIRSFHVISSKSGISTPTAITGGVAEALIATATGLAIAIFSVIVYNYMNERIKYVIEIVETRSSELLNTLADIEDRRNEVTKLSA